MLLGRRLIKAVLALGLAGLLAACANPVITGQTCPGLGQGLGDAPQVTRDVSAPFSMAPLNDARDQVARSMGVLLDEAIEDGPPVMRQGRRVVKLNLLAISTGGQYGSFASGFLSGWSSHGSRPEFDVVTGASAGGIVAPLAFAGSEFDSELGLNAGIDEGDVVTRRNLLGLLRSSALYTTGRLKARVRNAFGEGRLGDVLAERRSRGNLLFVGATNLNTGRFEAFDLGEFAYATDLPDAQRDDCLTEAVMATSAIPGLFPPQRINGDLYVDAGVREHIFLRGVVARIREEREERDIDVEVTAYLLVNSDLRVSKQQTESGIAPVARRSFDLLIDEGLRQSILQTVALSEESGWNLRAAIAPEFDQLGCPRDASLFSSCITRALFEVGRKRAEAGDFRWKTAAELKRLAEEF